jgi:flagellar hook-associated protein 2
VIDVGGTTTTVTSAFAGTAVAIDTGAGTLDVTLSGGLRVGDVDVAVVSTGDRSLSAVAAAITGAGAGVNAAAVKVGTDQWRLQLTSTKTGEDAQIAIDTSALTGLGGMIESSQAVNAQITIGSGAGAYTVEASGNTFTDVMPGVTLTAKEVSASQVTVSVERDDEAIAGDVSNMISSINDLLADIKVQTRTDPTAGTSGPLAGNATIRQLADQMRDALANQVVGLSLSLPSGVGIQRTSDGSFKFDRSAFLDAIADDPAAVSRLFSRGGTDTGDAVFAAADRFTVSGSYAVEVTTAATRATSATLFDGGGTATRVGVRVGTTTATVDVQLGQSVDQIIDDLNQAFAASDLAIVAETDGTGLRIRAEEWGTNGDFELNTDVLGVGTWDALAGTDVAGTIDGIVADGHGRRLTLGTSVDSNAAGLGIDIADGVTGALGNVEYLPGIAARVVEVTSALTETGTGLLTTAKEFAEARIEDFGDQIQRLEDRLTTREINMRRQWAAFQTVLSGLQSQGDWLGGQLASLSNNWAG